MSDIKLIVDYENGNIQVVTNATEDKFKKSGSKAGRGFASNFNENVGRSIGATIKNIALSATALGVVGFGKIIKDATAIEQLESQFKVLLKSSTLAQRQLEDLQAFASTTPFEIQGLATATKQLLSFGTAQADVIPTLSKLGDIASVVGADITELTIPFGRLVSTQKLTLIELDKFADRGVNIYQQLSDQTGRSLKTIRRDIENSRIPFEEFTKAIDNLTGSNGVFFNGIEARSRTLQGVYSNLADTIFNVSASIGKKFTPLIIKSIKSITENIEKIGEKIKNEFEVFRDLLIPITNFNRAFIEFVVSPFELLLNVAKVVQSGLDLFFAQSIANIGNFGFALAKVLDTLGVGEGLSQDLKDFEETSEQVAREVQANFVDALGKIGDFPLTASLAGTNEELATYFKEQAEIIEQNAPTPEDILPAPSPERIQLIKDQFASTFAILTASSNIFASTIGSSFDVISNGIDRTNKQITESQTIITKFASNSAKVMRDGFGKGIGQAFTEFGSALAKGENAVEAFGKAFLKSIGDTIAQQGQAFILEGIAYTFSANPVLASKGPGLIAAGAGLSAFGGVLGGISGGGGSASSGGGGGSTAGSALPTEPTGEFLEEATASTPTTNVVFNIEGNVKGDESFIRDLITDIGTEGGKQGLVFDNFATA